MTRVLEKKTVLKDFFESKALMRVGRLCVGCSDSACFDPLHCCERHETSDREIMRVYQVSWAAINCPNSLIL